MIMSNYRTEFKRGACFGTNEITTPAIGKKWEGIPFEHTLINQDSIIATYSSFAYAWSVRQLIVTSSSHSAGAFTSVLALGWLYSNDAS
jgi:hypothetical protein